MQRLKTILGKLLLLSQADSGQLPVHPSRVNLADLARAAAEDARLLAPDRATTLDAPQELFVTADVDLLNQVLQNLVSSGGDLTLERSDERGTAFALTLPLVASMIERAGGADRSPVPAGSIQERRRRR